MSIENQIKEKLENEFCADYLEVINESYRHAVPEGSESHFKVTIVAKGFNGMPLVKRHQSVNKLLKDELAHAIHALALHTYSPEEWEQKKKSPDSPDCLGGEK